MSLEIRTVSLAMLAGVIALTPLVYVALWVLMPSES